jgi:Family of unknown function (DUF6104)
VSSNGVERLRDKRGDEEVTFADVADHFEDFVNRHPDSRETVDELALFLAGVEDVDHEHREEGPALGP